MPRGPQQPEDTAAKVAGNEPRLAWLGLLCIALLLVLLALAGVQARQVWQGSAVASVTTAATASAGPASEVTALRQRVQDLELKTRAAGANGRWGLLLTLLLAVLMAACAALALRQLRSLREHRNALEDLAQTLRVARGEAEAASQAKSAFLATMSHEIQTPFHRLVGMLSLLREAGLTPRQIDHLRTATESADHLLALLNDIFDLSQLESGHLRLSPAPTLLRTLLRDVEALTRPQAAAKALTLHLDAEPAVPERMVLDATRVKQIVFNLLSNAIKFSDHGAVLLDVRCPAAVADDGAADLALRRLEFIVTDTGIGMDEATQSRLFSRRMQGDGSRAPRPGSSGLGLEISRHLARLMGGDITLHSRPGAGSRFTFWMPLQALPGEAEGAAPAARADAGTARALRVLVAEDHPVNRSYMAALLEGMGHRAHFTSNGQEAVEAASARRFDLILMDLHMPVLDGIGATHAIRALPDPGHSTVPIVALTADAFPETQDRCLVAGMNDFLMKPVSPPVLATCLRRLFGSNSATPGHSPSDTASAGVGMAGGAGLVDAAAMRLTLQAIPAHRLAALITGFLDQAPETVQRLRAAVRDAQLLDLRVHAHAAKGAALNLGLTGLAQTAQALQDGAAHLPAHEIARLVQSFEAQLPATRIAAQAALERAATPGAGTPIAAD